MTFRIPLIVFILLSLSSGLRASAQVTPREAAQGWISLFDGETLFGWNQIGDAHWKVSDGKIVCDGGSGGWIASSSQFADFELVVRLKVDAGTSSGVMARAMLEGSPSANGTAVIPIPAEESARTQEVRVKALGTSISVTLDGDEVEGLQAGNLRGFVGIQYHHRGHRIEIESAKLRPLSLRSLFNGRDLAGWKILPERRSKFSAEDGILNIKDGNGQIETLELFEDFVLQLDIISNGQHLNSGVFFRGAPGKFWKGYESQIRNQWKDNDRTAPVDYGTGGNYGNQPARRVVANDHEWFTKTIVCHGNHASIWIDGYLTSDFTDTRPVSESHNGKRGYIPGAGTIHLQGHDPKTDLSFRNIRIGVYPQP